jgi:SAM-dependent methyltransferase
MFQYNHNEHYADLLLLQVPSDCRKALDVGCGDGGFARRLADRFSAAVTGIDKDRAMIERARGLAGDRSIRFVEADFMRYSFDELFDFIGASASLHHMPFEQALAKMASLLQPGGVLAVLGLFRQASLTDSAVALVAAPVNVCYALSRGWFSSGAPIKPPEMSLQEIRETVSGLLPGARLRRLLLWRYLLTWQKPQASAVCPPRF